MKFPVVFFILFLGIIILAACKKNDGVAPINPNGDSELALLMRDMFDETLEMKNQIDAGKKPDVKNWFKNMTTVEATEPEKVAMPIYSAFSKSYHERLADFEKASVGEMHKTFNGVVQSCMTCHQAMCPGPMVRIEKLWVEQ